LNFFFPPTTFHGRPKVISLKGNEGSWALIIASIWTGLVHLTLGVLGTFVLKRFPTSFSVGFLLGVMVVLANQNLIMFTSFASYSQGSHSTNSVFSSLGFTLFAALTFMSVILLHFKADIVVMPMEEQNDDIVPPEP
jgi:zinc transporter ZupT